MKSQNINKPWIKTLIPVLLIVVIFFLSSCGTRSDNSVSFMVFGDPAERQAYLDLVDAFEAVHPEIEIAFSHIPSPRDYRTRLATEFAAGTPPDVTLMNYRRYASFAASGLLEPLGAYLDESALISRTDFYPIALDAFVWQEALMCIPQNISSLVVYYNQDMFDANGISYPAGDWTWEDFLNTAISLTKDTDGDGVTDQFGVGIEPSLFRLAPFVWQNRAVIVDDDSNPTRLTLTRPPSEAALQWFVDLQMVHRVVPNKVQEASLDSESRFIAGTTGMYFNSRRGTPTYREIETFVWDVAPLPRGRETAGILHSDAYCMSEAAENKDAAWKFIEFANSPEGQTIIAGSGRTVPSLIQVAESEAFLDPGKLPGRPYVWLDTVPTLRRVPVISNWQEIENIADQEIERAFYGDISVSEAAVLSFTRTEEYFFLSESAGPK